MNFSGMGTLKRIELDNICTKVDNKIGELDNISDKSIINTLKSII